MVIFIKICALSSVLYEDTTKNYGDCFIIDLDEELFVFDCGSEEHARRVKEYMEANNYSKVSIILSHNDSDHFDGIPFLIDYGVVDSIYTVLLLKYKDEILELIDDGRKTRESVVRDILDKYDNIAKLSGQNLINIYDEDGYVYINSKIKIIGPSKEYMLETVAKRLDGREGDTVDGETAVNATSIQVEVSIGNDKLLLCGDCSFEAIDGTLHNYSAIQLPHHGKSKQANKIFDEMLDRPKTIYIVSDNTGNHNGGSDDLDTRGHDVRNTKDKDIVIGKSDFSHDSYRSGCFGL